MKLSYSFPRLSAKARQKLADFQAEPNSQIYQASLKTTVMGILEELSALPKRSHFQGLCLRLRISRNAAGRWGRHALRFQLAKEKRIGQAVDFVLQACMPGYTRPTPLFKLLETSSPKRLGFAMSQACAHLSVSSPALHSAAFMGGVSLSMNRDNSLPPEAQKLFSMAIRNPGICEALKQAASAEFPNKNTLPHRILGLGVQDGGTGF